VAELVEMAGAAIVGSGKGVDSVEGPAEHVGEYVRSSFDVLNGELELGKASLPAFDLAVGQVALVEGEQGFVVN